MISKKQASFYFITTLMAGGLVAICGILSNRKYLCNFDLKICYTRFDNFLGALFLLLLFISSIFFIRLISTDTGFASWKKFMKYFTPIAVALAFFGGFSDGGGSWAVGGHDNEITMWLLGIVYVAGSSITIVKHRKH